MDPLKKLLKSVLKSYFQVKQKGFATKSWGLLDGVNVLDMTRVIAGPFSTMMLGDLGANVIKVETLDGEEARKWGPPFINGSQDSFYFLSVNRNKKSICIDLKKEEGKMVYYDLAKKSDVVVENFIPGKLDELGIGYEKLSKICPSLIYCAITGFGPSGPYAKKPGYDVIASAMGGLLNCTGEKDGNPVKPGVAITDVTTGLHAFGAITTALYYREKTGKGQKIDCNLLSTQIASMINVATIYLNCGIEPQRWGTAHANLVPYQAFNTKDGSIVIGTGSNAQFADLCQLIMREELITDSRFKNNSDRVKNRDVLINMLSDVIKTKTNKEWTIIFKKASFPNGPINKMKDVFEDEHVKAIGLVKNLSHPEAGAVKLVGPPTIYSEGGNLARTAPPVIGQHTREVLSSFLGYHDEKINVLFKDNVETSPRVTVITLRAPQTSATKRVAWTEDTVDNEEMNKKKSKCCCIYEKPRKFDESSSSDSDDECEHCFGHVERRKKRHQGADAATTSAGSTQTQVETEEVPQPEPTTTVTLQAPPQHSGPEPHSVT
ncbi:Succinate--hydroxymethylglutarate CoA-transferase [Eumeta japonica]|uniref:Succinate--hydroxymethylglutarate CoA-transferase n=1 Tax=Eumeta variegata TaxID=151549 RepID=A0A4C1Z6N8_EUMVA|nr:Succinate--hydroxymethylglutarate CoA-transferase [Eumeta japonica]